MKYHVSAPSGKTYEVGIIAADGSRVTVEIDGRTVTCDVREIEKGHLFSMILDGRSHDVTAEPASDGTTISMDGRNHEFRVLDDTQKRLEVSGGGRRKRAAPPLLKAEMPGVVVSIAVSAGDSVRAGDVLLVVEAMKMQNEISAVADAEVVDVPVAAGQVLAAGDPLVKLKYAD